MIQKTKKMWGTKQQLRKFKEPCLFFITKDKNIIFYEADRFYETGFLPWTKKRTKFRYKNEEDMVTEYEFKPQDQCTFQYAGEDIKCYVQYEEALGPYPHKPINEALHILNLVEKTMTDLSKWKLQQEIESRKKMMIWVWLALIAAGGYIVYKFLVKPQAQTIVVNLANATLNATGIGPVG